jgi:MoxR-like ATPase
MTNASELERLLGETIGEVAFGMESVVHALTVALAIRGHVLLQGVPGIGKTLVARTLAGALGGSFKRIQGTADLMPSDITGIHVWDTARQAFEFRRGPLFADVVLVDEINRAGPKTQSALLEAMEERQVTVDRETFALPAEFFVIATQNPQELEGTYPLPESQLDRFVMRIEMSYPPPAAELAALERYGEPLLPPAPPLRRVPPELLAAARRDAAAVVTSAELMQYVHAIALATRQSERLSLGLSTRGTIALLRCARMSAAIHGQAYVTPDDVRRVAPWVMGHRLQLRPEASLAGEDVATSIGDLLAAVAVPR